MTEKDGVNPKDGLRLDALTEPECLELLASQAIGRVAVADFGTAPLVVPVNFLLDAKSVLFRTDYGSKFRMAVLSERPVSFEVDGVDPGRRTGWSVLIQGSATEVSEEDLSSSSLATWAPGTKPHWVRIDIERITGRRIRLSASGGPDPRGYL